MNDGRRTVSDTFFPTKHLTIDGQNVGHLERSAGGIGAATALFARCDSANGEARPHDKHKRSSLGNRIWRDNRKLPGGSKGAQLFDAWMWSE
jgi:hypothetical protein